MPGFADVVSHLKAMPWGNIGKGALGGALAGGTLGEILGRNDSEEDKARRVRRYMLYGALPGAALGGVLGGPGGRWAGGAGGATARAPKGTVHPKDVDWLRGVQTKADAKKRFRAAARQFHPDFATSAVDRAAREESMKKINQIWDSVQQHPAFTKMSFFCGVQEACVRFGLSL